MFILLRKQHLKNMAHQPFSRIFLMTCYSVASAHIVPYIVLAARGLTVSCVVQYMDFLYVLLDKLLMKYCVELKQESNRPVEIFILDYSTIIMLQTPRWIKKTYLLNHAYQELFVSPCVIFSFCNQTWRFLDTPFIIYLFFVIFLSGRNWFNHAFNSWGSLSE